MSPSKVSALEMFKLLLILLSSSQLLHLFNQLKTEILQSHMMEKTFILIQELLTGAEKSFNLKKYFWKVLLVFSSVLVFWEHSLISFFHCLVPRSLPVYGGSTSEVYAPFSQSFIPEEGKQQRR